MTVLPLVGGGVPLDLVTVLAVALVLPGLLAGAFVLAHAELVGPVGLAGTVLALVVLVVGLSVFVLGVG